MSNNLDLKILITFLFVGCQILSSSTSQESPAGNTKDTCSALANCNECLKNSSCVYFSCENHNEKKCGQNGTSIDLCGGNGSLFYETCTSIDSDQNANKTGESDKDNPVDELGDDSKAVEQKQERKYHATQHFDLASFVGGIALSVCLAGIIFIVYKLWQSKQGHHNYSSVDGKMLY